MDRFGRISAGEAQMPRIGPNPDIVVHSDHAGWTEDFCGVPGGHRAIWDINAHQTMRRDEYPASQFHARQQGALRGQHGKISYLRAQQMFARRIRIVGEQHIRKHPDKIADNAVLPDVNTAMRPHVVANLAVALYI